MTKKNSDFEDVKKWYVDNVNKFNKLDNIAKRNDISFMQYEILSCIISHGFDSPSAIAEELRVSRASISRSLNRMMIKGYIEKVHGNPSDQRTITIKATESGFTVMKQVEEELKKYTTSNLIVS